LTFAAAPEDYTRGIDMKILIGIDFSEESIDAARQGFAMAERFRQSESPVDVVVAYVEGSGAWYPKIGVSSLLDDPDNRRRMQGQVEDFLQENLAPKPGQRLDYTLLVDEGRARKKLVDIVRRIDADWLFVGRSGSGALVRTALGSTSQSLANRPPCNLAIAHAKSPDWQASPKLAVGVDFSKHGHKALRLAINLTRKTGARLHLLHVIYPPGPVALPGGGIAYAGGEYLEVEAVRERSNAEMRKLVETHAADLQNLQWTSEVVTGYPTHEIVAYARRHDIDAIVMGSVGRSAFDNFLLGSVAGGVVKHIPCTVYLTPPAD
jgi:nucleotide-binding universal stress UspA family protein